MCPCGSFGRRTHGCPQLTAKVVDLDVERLQHLQAEVAALVDHAEQHVLGTDVVVGDVARRLLGEGHGLASRGREATEQADPRPGSSSGGSSDPRAAVTSRTARSSAAWQMADTGSCASLTAAASSSGR